MVQPLLKPQQINIELGLELATRDVKHLSEAFVFVNVPKVD
jgi:hypothetical protein